MPLNRHRKIKPGRTPAPIKLPPPKRARRQTLEVFAILAEAGAGGPEGWFEMPWRRGAEHVVEMLRQIYERQLAAGYPTDEERAAESILDLDFPDSSMAYAACEEARFALLTCVAPRPRVELLHAALRACQLHIANSDGGGHAYNALLLNRWPMFDVVDAEVAHVVRDARRDDAVGDDPRYRRAFSEAWDAGLYRAALALG